MHYITQLLPFLGAVYHQWVSVVISGSGAMVILALFERWTGKAVSLKSFWRGLIVAMLVGCYFAWLEEHDTRIKAEDDLAKIVTSSRYLRDDDQKRLVDVFTPLAKSFPSIVIYADDDKEKNAVGMRLTSPTCSAE